MATIAKIRRKSGVAFKAIIRDRAGRPIKSKTFTRKATQGAWAKRIEGDRERIAALGAPGAGIGVNRLRAAGSGLFRFARQRGDIRNNPFQGVVSKTERNKRLRYLDADERGRLLTPCDASTWPTRGLTGKPRSRRRGSGTSGFKNYGTMSQVGW